MSRLLDGIIAFLAMIVWFVLGFLDLVVTSMALIMLDFIRLGVLVGIVVGVAYVIQRFAALFRKN